MYVLTALTLCLLVEIGVQAMHQKTRAQLIEIDVCKYVCMHA